MTGTRVKPARRNEEEGDGKDGLRCGGSQMRFQTYSLATDNISSPWLCRKSKMRKQPGVSARSMLMVHGDTLKNL